MLTVVALGVLAGGILLFRAGAKLIGTLIGALGFALLAVVILLAVTGEAYRIPGESMRPTLQAGERVIAVDLGDPGVGDVVILNPPSGARDDVQCGARVAVDQLCPRPRPERLPITFVERIVARGGDRIALRGGHVIRNGKPLREPYAQRCSEPRCDYPVAITVPRGHVYVLGDNRGSSDDSRFWGPLPTAWLKGRVIGRYWPPKRFGGV